jgi:hypothetical protein
MQFENLLQQLPELELSKRVTDVINNYWEECMLAEEENVVGDVNSASVDAYAHIRVNTGGEGHAANIQQKGDEMNCASFTCNDVSNHSQWRLFATEYMNTITRRNLAAVIDPLLFSEPYNNAARNNVDVVAPYPVVAPASASAEEGEAVIMSPRRVSKSDTFEQYDIAALEQLLSQLPLDYTTSVSGNNVAPNLTANNNVDTAAVDAAAAAVIFERSVKNTEHIKKASSAAPKRVNKRNEGERTVFMSNSNISTHPLSASRKEDVITASVTSCKCKKNKCLQKYCACLGAGGMCGDACECEDCHNRGESQGAKVENQNEVSAQELLRSNGHLTLNKRNMIRLNKKISDGRGCNCAQSNCRKKYCMCFSAGVECDPEKCRCINCENCKVKNTADVGSDFNGTKEEVDDTLKTTTNECKYDNSVFFKSPDRKPITIILSPLTRDDKNNTDDVDNRKKKEKKKKKRALPFGSTPETVEEQKEKSDFDDFHNLSETFVSSRNDAGAHSDVYSFWPKVIEPSMSVSEFPHVVRSPVVKKKKKTQETVREREKENVSPGDF